MSIAAATSIAASAANTTKNASSALSPQQAAATKAAAKDFEAVFISEMLNHMFEGISADPMFGGGEGEDMFRGMLNQEYGKEMAKGQGIGISDQLQKMMIQMQQQKG